MNNQDLQNYNLEQKSDNLLNDQIHRLNQTLDSTQQRLLELELATQRPYLDVKGSYDLNNTNQHIKDGYHEAFYKYIRKGIEQDLSRYEQKALSAGVEAEGGYLLPAPTIEKIIQRLNDTSNFRRIASVINISTDVLEMLIDRDNAEVGWVAEKDERPETKTPELAKLRINVHEMYAKPRATQKLLDDSQIDAENWIVNKISERMGQIENHAFVYGDGKNQPKGLLDYPKVSKNDWSWGKIACVKTGKEGGFDDNNIDPLLEVISIVKAGYLHKSQWLLSRSVLLALRKLRDKEGNYLWQPGIAIGDPMTLFGYPVTVLEEMPSIDDEKATILFGDFSSAYQIVDRHDMRVLRDPYSAKPYVEFYATRRVGGDVINFEALAGLVFKA